MKTLFTEEQFNQLKQCADAFTNAIHQLVDTLKQIWNRIKERWDKFKKMYDDVDELMYSYHSHHWTTPMKMVRPSLVLNRKPVIHRARSNC